MNMYRQVLNTSQIFITAYIYWNNNYNSNIQVTVVTNEQDNIGTRKRKSNEILFLWNNEEQDLIMDDNHTNKNYTDDNKSTADYSMEIR